MQSRLDYRPRLAERTKLFNEFEMTKGIYGKANYCSYHTYVRILRRKIHWQDLLELSWETGTDPPSHQDKFNRLEHRNAIDLAVDLVWWQQVVGIINSGNGVAKP